MTPDSSALANTESALQKTAFETLHNLTFGNTQAF
jgi:hypothetical protein